MDIVLASARMLYVRGLIADDNPTLVRKNHGNLPEYGRRDGDW